MALVKVGAELQLDVGCIYTELFTGSTFHNLVFI